MELEKLGLAVLVGFVALGGGWCLPMLIDCILEMLAARRTQELPEPTPVLESTPVPLPQLMLEHKQIGDRNGRKLEDIVLPTKPVGSSLGTQEFVQLSDGI